MHKKRKEQTPRKWQPPHLGSNSETLVEWAMSRKVQNHEYHDSKESREEMDVENPETYYTLTNRPDIFIDISHQPSQHWK